VHASHDFQTLAPPPLRAARDWAPTAHYGGYHSSHRPAVVQMAQKQRDSSPPVCRDHRLGEAIWGLGCDCFAF
jgi:hypothetical protein